jgi:hypothetical protein
VNNRQLSTSLAAIDTATWEAVVREAETHIAKWNAHAREHGKDDMFRAFVRDVASYQVLCTEHAYSGHTERKAIARTLDTGELMSARIVKNGREIVFRPAPASWQTAVRQGPAAIVKAARLCDYILILGSRVTEVTSHAEL